MPLIDNKGKAAGPDAEDETDSVGQDSRVGGTKRPAEETTTQEKRSKKKKKSKKKKNDETDDNNADDGASTSKPSMGGMPRDFAVMMSVFLRISTLRCFVV